MIRKNILDVKKNYLVELNNSALLTVGGKDNFNAMTINWGGIGVLYNKNVCFIFIRNSRYSKELLEKTNCFTLSFFDGKYYDLLQKFGMISGRNIDKFSKIGFTPVYDIDSDSYYVREASSVIKANVILKNKIAINQIVDKSILNKFYSDFDFHTIYIAEIKQYLERTEEDDF